MEVLMSGERIQGQKEESFKAKDFKIRDNVLKSQSHSKWRSTNSHIYKATITIADVLNLE